MGRDWKRPRTWKAAAVLALAACGDSEPSPSAMVVDAAQDAGDMAPDAAEQDAGEPELPLADCIVGTWVGYASPCALCEGRASTPCQADDCERFSVAFFHPDGTCNSFTAERSEMLRVFNAFVASTEGSLPDSCTYSVEGDEVHRFVRDEMPIPGLPETIERVQQYSSCTATELRWSDDTGSFSMLRAPDDFAAGVERACAGNDFSDVSY